MGGGEPDRPVYFIGPLPPPTSGQSFATRLLLDACREAQLQLVVVNTIRGASPSVAKNALVRATRVLSAMFVIVFGRPGRSYYISVDANLGMAITCVYAAAARLRGGRISLHHHTYSHISAPNPLGSALVKAAGPHATHICICERMSDDLRKAYPLVRNTKSLSNIRFVDLPPVSELNLSRPIGPTVRLGHMSRMSEAKGIVECIALLDRLLAEGVKAELHLAGAIDLDAKPHIERAEAEHGDKVVLHGFLSGDDKKAFFSSLDFFIFPTKYRNETQGIVNLEAMSFGIPVIAFDRCCIGSDAEGSGGLAVPPGDDFVGSAATFIVSSLPDLAHLRSLARDRFELLHRNTYGEINDVVGGL